MRRVVAVRRGLVTTLGLLVGALALAACSASDSGSGGASSTTGSSGHSGSASTSGPPPTATTTVTGERVSVAGASVALPTTSEGWEEQQVDTAGGTEETRWVSRAQVGGGPRSIVTLNVQGAYDVSLEGYKAYVRTLGGKQVRGIWDDPHPAEGTKGVIAEYQGPVSSTSTATPFTSIIRTWLTPGRTKITVTVVAERPTTDPYDPVAIADSLQWNGTEAPAATSSRTTGAGA